MSPKYEGPERRVRNGGPTWKIIASAFAAIITLGGSAWLTTIAGDITDLKKDQRNDRQETQDLKGKVNVIEERTRRTEQDVKEIKEDTRRQNEKLDELLRRTRTR